MTLIKRLLIVSSLAFLGGCVSAGHYQTVTKLTTTTPNIAYAPAIDVPYSESEGNNNNGIKVRWGGQVVESLTVDDSLVRLTIAALPLTHEGRPEISAPNAQQTNYFVVDLNEDFSQSVRLKGHLVTFYGELAGEKNISIDNRNVSVPNLNLIEVVDWNLADRELLAQSRRRNDLTYYHNVGYGRYSRSSFGHGFGYSSFSSRGYRRSGFGGGGYCRY